ncbi:MAG: A/G-specific adenine glycosylase [Verrucomicrobiales bacterium]|nr:A/G-specific adenine glycosylase [Verrucomicrobiales bacterium]
MVPVSGLSCKPESLPGAFDPSVEAADFARALIDWFRREGRDYPWRRTRDPYAILVSEIMLQQTQIATVLGRGYYDRWFRTFPDVGSLAAAPEDALLKAWEGLGYYNRVRNLQRAARAVIDDHEGRFPETVDGLLTLPGVGRYTAGAVASFAFDLPAPLVDGNVARVFSRLGDLHDPVDAPATLRRLWDWAAILIPAKDARAYNNALMELGQQTCTKSAPSCQECPVARHCRTHEPETLPVKKAARSTVAVIERVVWSLYQWRVLLDREIGSRRRGLWQLPALDPDLNPIPVALGKWKYAITHHRVELIAHRGSPAECARPGDGEWISVEHGLQGLALSAPHRRALESLLASEQFSLSG